MIKLIRYVNFHRYAKRAVADIEVALAIRDEDGAISIAGQLYDEFVSNAQSRRNHRHIQIVLKSVEEVKEAFDYAPCGMTARALADNILSAWEALR